MALTPFQVDLRRLIRDEVDCGCCHLVEEAINRMALYFEAFYGDLTIEQLNEAQYVNLMTDMYYFYCHDQGIPIALLEEPRPINAGHKTHPRGTRV